MKVLLANKFFYRKGGAEVVFFATAKLLQRYKHEVVFFCMEHPQNLLSPFDKYFVSNVDLSNGHGLVQQLKSAGRILYSFQARDKISRLIREERPAIAHLHNIYHQISPSIIDALKKRDIPIVMTLHDYKLTCPVYTLFSKGKVCEKCKGGRYYRAFLSRCTKGSRSKSAVNVVEMYLHHKILQIYKRVDLFISPSKFLIEKTKEMGFKGDIVYLPNFVDLTEYQPSYNNDNKSVVYFGRLSREKGLSILIDAVKGLDVQLKIIGDGPQREQLVEKVKREGLKNVVLMGYKTSRQLHGEIEKSIVVVVPSEWYENNPRSIIEAFALGKPAVGARVGGISELVKDEETGLTFEAGDPRDLRKKIESLVRDKDKVICMGKRARELVERDFTPEKHYKSLIKIYKMAMERN